MFGLLLLLPLATPARGAADEAIPKDVRRLQDALANLDEVLEGLEPGDPVTESFRERAAEVKEEVIYLKVKMRHQQKEGLEGTGVTRLEVASVQSMIDGLRGDIEGAFGADNRDQTLDVGTEIVVRLEEALSSKTARREHRFEAAVLVPVRAQGRIALPAGTRVRGIVRDAQAAQRPSRSGRLELEFDALFLDTKRIDMRARLAAMEGEGRPPEQKAGIGAILGGVVGGIFGGKTGAIVGVVLGGTGAVVGTKGEDVELPEGATLTLRLEESLVVPRSGG
jgi:hypothetical protein